MLEALYLQAQTDYHLYKLKSRLSINKPYQMSLAKKTYAIWWKSEFVS